MINHANVGSNPARSAILKSKQSIMTVEVVIALMQGFTYISISCDKDVSLSWEQVQRIKDEFFPNTSFIEVYPPKNQVVNKANVRHLFDCYSNRIPTIEDTVQQAIKIDHETFEL